MDESLKKLQSVTLKNAGSTVSTWILNVKKSLQFISDDQSIFHRVLLIIFIFLVALILSFILRFMFPESPEFTELDNLKTGTIDKKKQNSPKGLETNKISKNVIKVHEKISQNVAVPFFIDLLIYLIYIGAVFISLNILGVSTIHMVAIISSFGIAVALGLQNILSDLASGLLIATEGNFKIGDVVAVDDVIGKVRKVTLFRTGIQETRTNSLVYIPNKIIHDTKFKNLSANKYVATTIEISVSNRSYPKVPKPNVFNDILQTKDGKFNKRSNVDKNIIPAGETFEKDGTILEDQVREKSNDSGDLSNDDVNVSEQVIIDENKNQNFNFSSQSSSTEFLLNIIRSAILRNTKSSEHVEHIENEILRAPSLEAKEKLEISLTKILQSVPVVKKDSVIVEVADMSAIGTVISVYFHYRNEQYLLGEAMMKSMIRKELETFNINLIDNAYVEIHR